MRSAKNPKKHIFRKELRTFSRAEMRELRRQAADNRNLMEPERVLEAMNSRSLSSTMLASLLNHPDERVFIKALELEAQYLSPTIARRLISQALHSAEEDRELWNPRLDALSCVHAWQWAESDEWSRGGDQKEIPNLEDVLSPIADHLQTSSDTELLDVLSFRSPDLRAFVVRSAPLRSEEFFENILKDPDLWLSLSLNPSLTLAQRIRFLKEMFATSGSYHTPAAVRLAATEWLKQAPESLNEWLPLMVTHWPESAINTLESLLEEAPASLVGEHIWQQLLSSRQANVRLAAIRLSARSSKTRESDVSSSQPRSIQR